MSIRKPELALLAISFFVLCGAAQGADQKTSKPEVKAPAAAPSQGSKKPAKRTVAATVNGSPIYVDQLDDMLQREKRGSIHEEQLRLLRLSALQEAIQSELLYQEALRHKAPDLEKKVLAREKEIREGYPHLVKGKDPAQIRENIRRKIAIEHYLGKAGITNPSIPEAEIKALYQKQKGQFTRKEAVHVRHILVQAPADAKEEDRKKARAKAEEARRLLSEGKPFEEVAKKYSEDKAAQAGGDIGFVTRGFMPPPVDQAAFSTPKGKVSDVLESKFGFHIVEVLEKQPAGLTPYEEVRDWLHKYLQEGARRKKMEELMTRLKKNAKIAVYLK